MFVSSHQSIINDIFLSWLNIRSQTSETNMFPESWVHQVCWCRCTTFRSLQIRRLRAWLYGNLLTFPLIGLSPMMSTGPGDSTTKAPELHQVRSDSCFTGQLSPEPWILYVSIYMSSHVHNYTQKQKNTEKAYKLTPVSLIGPTKTIFPSLSNSGVLSLSRLPKVAFQALRLLRHLSCAFNKGLGWTWK